MTVEEMQRRLFARTRSGMKLGLDRMEKALDLLGIPSSAVPVLHVAGTNGKGSTCAFAESLLRHAGLRTGLYTSPHLERLGERFRVDFEPASDDALLGIHEELEVRLAPMLDGPDPLTFFEMTTLMGFSYFSKQAIDVLVCEVGLGGRLDATNVVTPEVAVIAPVDLDHQEYLGDTIALIASEKAGILKPPRPGIVARQQPEARAVIEAMGADLAWEGEDFGFDGTTLRLGDRRIDDVELGLRGPHQRTNAALAAMAVISGRFGIDWTDDRIRSGLAQARWPGRFETVATAPELILDGAHNPHGARALAETIRSALAGRRVHLVFGALGDKDAESVIAALAPVVASILVTSPDSPRALPVDQLLPIVRRHHAAAEGVDRSEMAVQQAISRCRGDDVVLVAGSLYLVGEVRAALGARRVDDLRERFSPIQRAR